MKKISIFLILFMTGHLSADANKDLLKAVISKKENVQAVRRALRAGASPNTKTANEYTVLMAATGKGYRETVKVLLAAGADVNASVGGIITALAIATQKRDAEMIKLLKAAGAKENDASKASDDKSNREKRE